MKLFRFFIIIPLYLFSLSAAAQTAADKIIGIYLIHDDTSGEDAKVKIYKNKSGTYDGRIIWLKKPNFKDGTPKRDILNPDPSKRNTLGTEIPLIFHFRYDESNKKWVDGEIYDPWHGKTYKCKMWFESTGKLRVRGYIGVPALGRTMVWTKIQ